MVDALILAGGSLERERFEGLRPGIERKAEIPILGVPMVEWVARALRGSTHIQRIVVVGHPSLSGAGLAQLCAVVVPEAHDLAENLKLGVDALPDADRVLVLSGDLPLLTPGAVADLLENAPPADIVFPYIERADIRRDFPDRVWVFAETPDGAFTGCSAALIRPDAVRENWPWVEGVLGSRRRSPIGLALMIGPLFALKYFLHRLRVADVEHKLSAVLHLEGRGYRTRYSELAMDVDKFTDVGFAEQVLRRRETGEPG